MFRLSTKMITRGHIKHDNYKGLKRIHRLTTMLMPYKQFKYTCSKLAILSSFVLPNLNQNGRYIFIIMLSFMKK